MKDDMDMKKKIISAIKSLIDDETISLNRHGAVGFVDKDCIWFHSKRFIDDLSWIEGIESDKDELRSIMLELGLLVKKDSGTFTHKKEIRSGGKSYILNLLCLPLKNIWNNPEHYPSRMEDIDVVDV